MLDNPSKYKLFTPPNGMIINGGIMPARDVNPEQYGSWRLLRGEDPCFLEEASCRLYRYKCFGTGTARPVPNVGWSLDNDYMPQSAIRIHQSDFYVDSNNSRTWPVSPQWIGGGGYIPDVVQSGNESIVDFVDGCLVSSCRSVQSDWMASEGAGRVLIADNVRNLYHDLRQVTCVLSRNLSEDCGNPLTASGGMYYIQEWSKDLNDSWVHTTSDGPYSGYTSVLSLTRSDGYLFQANYTWSVNSVEPEYPPSPIAGLNSDELKCWVMFRVHTMYGIDEVGFEHHVDAYVAPGQVLADGTVTCSVISSDLMAGALANHGNLVESPWDLPEPDSFRARESITSDFAGVFFYDGDLDFSSLGWGWQPETQQQP